MAETADAQEQWADRLQASALKPGSDVDPQILADEIGPLPEAVADDVCQEAAMVATSDGSTSVDLTHFRAAIDVVLGEGDANGSDHESAHQAMERDELVTEVQRLRERVDGLEGQVVKLQEVGNRDVALLRGTLSALLGDPGDLKDFPEAAAEFREQVVDEGGDG